MKCTARDLFSIVKDVEVTFVKGPTKRFKPVSTTNYLRTKEEADTLVNKYFENNKETLKVAVDR